MPPEEPDAVRDDAPQDAETSATPVEVVIVVRVVRTGGFAGITREWTAEPPPDDVPKWRGLIHGCPWDAAASPSRSSGADRFDWRISAREADAPALRAELSDTELTGPWRDLVDEVRSFGDAPDRERTRR